MLPSTFASLSEYASQNLSKVGNEYPLWTAFVLLTGAWSLFRCGAGVLKFASTFFLTGGSIQQYARPGTWAVVTGATDGIGLEFVRQLAKKGFNIVLISRNPEKLGAIAGEIEGKYPGIRTKVYPLDFSRTNEKTWAALEHLCNTLDISVLVNNVGKSHTYPTLFAQTDLDEMRDIVAINVEGTLRMTRMLLPGMLQRGHRGLILNLGSISGMLPTPLLSTYAGTKAFLVHFTRSLEGELAGTKVDVKLLNTYYVVSEMSKIRRSSLLVPTPKAYVASVLSHPKSVGRGAGGRDAPYWSHALIEFVLDKLVGVKNELLVSYVKGMNESIRKRALRKLERESGKKST